KHLLKVKEFGKESTGDCVQCKDKNLDIIDYLDHKLCIECFKYQMEVVRSGINVCSRYTKNKAINCYDYQKRKSCDQCSLCQERKKLTGISTLALMTELFRGRKDFNALIT
ncbi:7606_t:CDS:1, partial [Funneliformis geosporum]